MISKERFPVALNEFGSVARAMLASRGGISRIRMVTIRKTGDEEWEIFGGKKMMRMRPDITARLNDLDPFLRPGLRSEIHTGVYVQNGRERRLPQNAETLSDHGSIQGISQEG